MNRFRHAIYLLILTLGAFLVQHAFATQSSNPYVFPNPSGHGHQPTLHLPVNSDRAATLRIYDVSGEIVLETLIEPERLSDQNGALAYEYPLDPHIFRPGVYLGVVNEGPTSESRRKFRFTVTR